VLEKLETLVGNAGMSVLFPKLTSNLRWYSLKHAEYLKKAFLLFVDKQTRPISSIVPASRHLAMYLGLCPKVQICSNKDNYNDT